MNLTVELARFVAWIGMCRDIREDGGLQVCLIARINKDESIGFPTGVTSHTIRERFVLAKVGNTNAFSCRVIHPTVIAALNVFPFHGADVQRDLPMGAAILEGEQCVVLRSDQYNRIACEPDADGFSFL